MIHYGLQYRKLIELKAKELAVAKLKLSDAEREQQKKKKEAFEADQIAADETYKFEQISNEFRVLLMAKITDAVEAFKQAKGSYPI